MRRRIVIIVLIFICFILQCSVLPAVAIGGISPNLLVILTVSFALMRGRREGMFVGFMCGFLADLFFGSALGFQTLVYMYMGYLCGSCYRLFYDDDIKMPIWLMASYFIFLSFYSGEGFSLRFIWEGSSSRKWYIQ